MLVVQVPPLQVDAADVFKDFLPWLLFAATLAMILIRHGLRKPPQLATTDEVQATATDLGRLREEMQVGFKRLDDDLREYASGCATSHDVTELGKNVDRIDKFHLSLQDGMVKAVGRSGRAIREVTAIREEMKREIGHLRGDLAKLDDVPERIARIDENIRIFLRHQGVQGSRSGDPMP